MQSFMSQVKAIFKALGRCRIMVIFQTATYGSEGSDVFATYEELMAAKKERIPIYVVKMAPKVAELGVQVHVVTVRANEFVWLSGVK